MITGIDETGDFSLNSDELNFFVGIHIDQNGNNYSIKQSQFNIWEGGIPEGNKNNGEVKGKGLTEEQLESFYDNVISINPVCKYSVVQMKPSDNSEVILRKHQKIEVGELERMVKESIEAGKKDFAKEYDRLRIWTRGLNYQKMLKLKCLENIVGLSFAHCFTLAQFFCFRDNMDETNLSSIAFKIDKDFIRAENTKLLWGEIFRQFWRDYTRENKLIVMNETVEVTKKYFDISDDNKINPRDVFTKRTEFLESNENWEIRLADILGYIIHRYQNKGKCNRIGKSIFENLNKNNYVHLILNDV